MSPFFIFSLISDIERLFLFVSVFHPPVWFYGYVAKLILLLIVFWKFYSEKNICVSLSIIDPLLFF